MLVIERPTTGMGKETVLYRAPGVFYPESWSPDGRWLLLTISTATGAFGLEGRHPTISPDGRWLLYSSTQTGSREVFVQSMPEQMGGPAAGVPRRYRLSEARRRSSFIWQRTEK
jgi:Tol biopolymer transport system component